MIKLVALDIDGTILNSKGKVTEKTKKTIRKYQQQGIKFTLASGRAFYALQPLLKEVDIHDPIICCNGCVIQDPMSDHILYQSNLDRDIIGDVMVAAEKHRDIPMELYPMTSQGMVVKKGSELAVVFSEYVKEGMPKDTKEYVYKNYGENKEGLGILLSMYDDLNIRIVRDLHEVDKSTIIQMSLNFKLQDKEKVFSLLEKTIVDRATFVTTAENNFDIFAKDHNKGTGLKVLSEKLGLKQEEVAAIGNEGNDIEMLQFAGIGIAMGNSPDHIKEKANWIVRTNDEEGVSEAIEKLMQKH